MPGFLAAELRNVCTFYTDAALSSLDSREESKSVTDPLDAELDRLFQVPPAEMVAARNALADALRKAGDKVAAARVKALKRATPVAWAVNQVHFAHPELLERARSETHDLRELQAQRGVDGRQLAAAVEQQRRAAQAVVDAALRAGRDAGLSDAVLQQRKLLTTVQAWLAGKGDEAPGRMTQELEASGFDAFAGMTLSAAPPITSAPAASAPPAEHAALEESAQRVALERAAQLLGEREQLAATARERVRALADEQAAVRQARDRAQTSVRETERTLAAMHAELEQRERQLERCGSALNEAQAQQALADAAAAAARTGLAARSEK